MVDHGVVDFLHDVQSIGNVVGLGFVVRHCAQQRHDLVLPHVNDLTTEHFTEEAISYMIAELRERGDSALYSTLGQLATERFVNERLLPLAADTEPNFRAALRDALQVAGARHGRRYTLSKKSRDQ